MQSIRKYAEKNKKRMLDVFKSMGKHDKIQATKVFNYIQNSFDQAEIRFELYGKDFFDDDDNSTEMQKLLQSYYRINESDESKKFYLYRIQFTYDQIFDILTFWLQRQPNIKLITPQDEMRSTQRAVPAESKISENKQKLPDQQQKQLITPQNEQQQNNEFDVDDQSLPELVLECQRKIEQKQAQLKSAQTEQQKQKITSSINDMKMKIKVLEQRMKTTSLKKARKKEKTVGQPIEDSVRTQSPSTKSMKKVTINYKAIFQFYAKQTHLTGVKATFQRIEHQSQTINYQKLVHFLRQFNLLPSDVPSRKKVHGLYIKYSEATRDLKIAGFLNVLDGVVNILSPDKTKQERQQILKRKIYEKNIKNGKILNHPFHSLQKQDFRINVNELNYSFKLKPQDGKFVHEVNNSIQKRRQDKLEAKTERSKQKQLKEIRYLKKLQSIDPFSELLMKKSKILEEKTQQCQAIASLENIEKYRDNSFDFQGHFGIDLSQIGQGSPRKNANVEIKRQYSERYKRGEQAQKRVEQLEKDEASKMENLMSGLIERSNAKMQKLGISPTKLQKSVKFV